MKRKQKQKQKQKEMAEPGNDEGGAPDIGKAPREAVFSWQEKEFSPPAVWRGIKWDLANRQVNLI